jgi:hypothetical protein
MGESNRKLPRRPHADRPGPDEQILKKGGADLQNGWLARHGSLVVTDDRLVFVPTALDTLLGAKRREIALDDISEIERFPVSPNSGLPPGAKRPRMILHTSECAYELMVGDLDSWIDSLERVYVLRARKGKPHRPAITRDGYVNLLLLEE